METDLWRVVMYAKWREIWRWKQVNSRKEDIFIIYDDNPWVVLDMQVKYPRWYRSH